MLKSGASPLTSSSGTSSLPSAPRLSQQNAPRQMVEHDQAKPNQPQYYGPSRTALLFLDYENILINMISDPVERQGLIDSANQLLATARQNKVAIIHCLIDTSIDPPPTSKIYEEWFEVNKPAIEADPTLVEEYPDFVPPANVTGRHESISLRPPGPRSAFVNHDLLPLLREQLGVEHLILGGIGTSGVVLGTAIQGTDENFVVTVVANATWDPNPQVRKDLLEVVFPVEAYVVSTQEAVSYME